MKKQGGAVAGPKLNEKSLWSRIWEHRLFYIFLLPAFAWFLLFCYYPMYGVLLAFKNFKFSKGIMGSPWVGMFYFKQFLNDIYFWKILKNTVAISLLKMVCGFPMPIILALMLNEVRHPRFKKTIQTLSYLPHFVSWIVVISLAEKILSPYNGMINTFRQFIDPNAQAIYYLGETRYFYFLVVILDIWKGVGWGSIIYLAAMAGIDPTLYEVAELDGASRLRKCLHVTLPGIAPTICILLIMNMGGILNAGFDQIYLMQKAANLEVSEVLDTYVLKKGLLGGQYGYSTAIGLFKSVISMAFVVGVNAISRKVGEVSLW